MKKVLSFCMVAMMLMAATSCANLKAKHVISQLESLTEKVEKKGDQFTQNNWEEVLAEYEKICDKIGESEFTNEQLQEIGALKARFYVAYAESGIQQLGGSLNSVLQQAIGAMGVFTGETNQNMEKHSDKEYIEEDNNLKELEKLFE